MAEPLSEEERVRPKETLRERLANIPSREELLGEYVEGSKAQLENEKNRKEGVEARLTSIMGLSSIAGTVAFGGFFLGANGISHVQPRAIRMLLLAIGWFLTLQIGAALLAAVRGLSRRPYEHLELSDLVPGVGESNTAFLRRKTEKTLEVLCDHEAQNNEKITRMAIAHLAMRNFVWGLLAFALVAGIAATRSADNFELMSVLKQEHDAAELLRGAQGPQVVAGPKSDPLPFPCPPVPHAQQSKPGARKRIRHRCDCKLAGGPGF
jgi:hypothetical protein